MRLGYARVSSAEQETALQLAALEGAGVERVFQEKLSAVVRRPQLEQMLASLREGDQVVVYKIDRLARSLQHLLSVLDRIEAAGATFRSLTEPIETGTLLGRLMLQLLGSFAEFERGVIRERCAAGRAAAVARGVRFGRPRLPLRLEWHALACGGLSASEIARRSGCHPSTVSRALRVSFVWDNGAGAWVAP